MSSAGISSLSCSTHLIGSVTQQHLQPLPATAFIEDVLINTCHITALPPVAMQIGYVEYYISQYCSTVTEKFLEICMYWMECNFISVQSFASFPLRSHLLSAISFEIMILSNWFASSLTAPSHLFLDFSPFKGFIHIYYIYIYIYLFIYLFI